MQQNFKEHIIQLLLQDDRLKDEQGELRGNLVKEYVNTLDEKLISLLLEDKQTRNKFFLKIKDAYVFKTNEFKFFLDENSIDNSFTQYSNRIGLASGGKFLKDNTDVVLNFPFKDCILEGGQSTEDGLDTYFEDDGNGNYIEKQSKRKEIFFNEVLARDEIDRLLEPKAFTNITKYDSKGKSKPTKFNRNAKGTITDNLIIKGNNLLALHSLKKEFKGKIKLIYIDPPYNTGNDSFAYNDSFNHSTWLTFMRNRLIVARDLLREDGVIFVQCDDNEQAYLKILLDDIFKNGFINNLVAEMSNLSGNKIEHAIQGRKFPKIKEYILLYAKNKSSYKLTIPKNKKDKWDNEYNMIIPKLTIAIFNDIHKNIECNNEKELNSILSSLRIVSLKEYLKKNKILNIEKFRLDNAFKIIASKPNKALKKKAIELEYSQDIFALKNQRGTLKIIKTDFNRETDTARIELVFAENNINVYYGDIWHKITTTGGVAQEGGVVMKNGKKPEQLLNLIISTATSENDIVLDYHLGSGTTCAVAHKMNRRFIGCEQIDNQVDLSKKRLHNVILGEQSGVSKAYN